MKLLNLGENQMQIETEDVEVQHFHVHEENYLELIEDEIGIAEFPTRSYTIKWCSRWKKRTVFYNVVKQ